MYKIFEDYDFLTYSLKYALKQVLKQSESKSSKNVEIKSQNKSQIVLKEFLIDQENKWL